MMDVLSTYNKVVLKEFYEEKEPQTYFSYQDFRIRNFRGLEDVSITFNKDELVLLLGLNESGKTSILRAIEAFDYNNDPSPDQLKPYFTSIRNKHDIASNQPCLITARILFDEKVEYNTFKKIMNASGFGAESKGEIEEALSSINESGEVSVTRVIPFSNGNPGQSYYRVEGDFTFSNEKINGVLAQSIVMLCPFIMYFEDFQDAIPSKIFTNKNSDAYNQTWYDIIDGLFYNTNPNYNIKSFETYYNAKNPRPDDASTLLERVNQTLQKTFTEKWEDLAGVQEIERAMIKYSEKGPKFFEIKVTEKDGTTYSVHERSKGAIWYLAFLMKTEFRRKKLREGSGKPVYLIDEPASNLHSTAQQKMVEDFVRLVEDTSLIYTTHSQYLISPSHIKNAYVVSRTNGKVHCVKWNDYIKGKKVNTSYYQPLYDCLHIIPNQHSIPWEKSIITEGPSDAIVLELMRDVLEIEILEVIYPGTSASNLSTLISINLGWGSKFSILLDSDSEGAKQKKKYESSFSLKSGTIVLLPGNKTRIEDMFTPEEKTKLYKLCFNEEVEKVSKDEFLATFRVLNAKLSEHRMAIKEIIKQETIEKFRILFEELRAPHRGTINLS
ncbi:ATP-dependent nuclease [Tsuneonella suprasediminis]|uniref:ATP-dependent nuclease n=1 Tax=Tsuneonella suprasediminis TaxID=2306996 RepID=UPI002F92FCD5